MTLTFPNSPALNETIIYNDKIYKYDGKKWVSGFLNNNSISTEYIDYNRVTPTPDINLDLRKYNFFELNLGTSPNLFAYPEDFTKSPPWIATGLNGTMASGQTELTPDYTQTAEKLTENTTASVTRLFTNTNDFVKGTTYTVSMYVKRASGTRNFGIVLPSTPFGSVVFGCMYNLGTVTATVSAETGTINTAANVSATITDAGNGWYRCSITATAIATVTATIQFRMISGTGLYSTYTGDGTSALFLWGAKLEVGKLTNYIPPEITNKLKYSEQFSNSVWTKLNTTITENQVSAPDGTLTGDLMLETITSGQHSVSYNTVITDLINRNYTYSIYVKKYNRARLRIQMANNAGTSAISANINLDTVTATLASSVGSGVAVSCSITPDINNWYRISLTGKTGVNEIQVMQLLVLDDTGTPYTGDITKGVYVWGAQLQKDTLTSYQKVEALAYYNVKFTESSENDMLLLNIKNQVKPDFNLELTAAGAGMTYANNTVAYGILLAQFQASGTYGMYVSPDGKRIYNLSTTHNFSQLFHEIHQSDLSTPWDISNATLSQGRIINAARLASTDTYVGGVAVTSMYISNDGVNMYVCKYGVSANVTHYVLPNPWNIATAVLVGTYSTLAQAGNFAYGITFKPDGSALYILNGNTGSTNTVFEYALSIPWNLSTATFTAGNSLLLTSATTNANHLQFSPDGTKLYFYSVNNTRLYQVDLTTAWKINTGVLPITKYVSLSVAASVAGFTISPDGLTTLVNKNIGSQSTTTLFQYNSTYLGALDYTLSWPSNIKWDGGSPPAITKSNQNTLIELYKYDGTWYAKTLANDI